MSSSQHRQLTGALVTTTSLATIEETIAHELAASGWSSNVRTYIEMLLRSGEATNYNDVMDRIMTIIAAPPVETANDSKKKGANGDVNGSTGNPIADMEKRLAIPEKVIVEGARAVKKELEKICEVVVDDV